MIDCISSADNARTVLRSAKELLPRSLRYSFDFAYHRILLLRSPTLPRTYGQLIAYIARHIDNDHMHAKHITHVCPVAPSLPCAAAPAVNGDTPPVFPMS